MQGWAQADGGSAAFHAWLPGHPGLRVQAGQGGGSSEKLRWAGMGGSTRDFLPTSQWPAPGHMATLYSKGGWEM